MSLKSDKVLIGLFAFSAYQDVNIGHKMGDCLIQELYRSITMSIQTFLKEIKTVVFEEDELEYLEIYSY